MVNSARRIRTVSALLPSRFVLRPFFVFSAASIALWVCLFTLLWNDEGHQHVANLAKSIITCPNPAIALHLPVNKPLLDIDSWHTHRRRLESQDPRFNITLLRSFHRPCNIFAIDIQRTDPEACRIAESRTNMTTNSDVLRYLQEELGPDTFMLRISGGQRWTSEAPRYQGNCQWRFDVNLSNGGDMWLELWHSYEVSSSLVSIGQLAHPCGFQRYKAFDEADSSDWIDYTRTPLLDQPLLLDLCSSRCKTHYFPRHNLSVIESYAQDPAVNPKLPPCGDNTISGVWLPWHPADKMYPPAPIIPPRTGSSPLMGQYHLQLDGCHLYHAGNQFLADHSRCTVREGGEKWNVMFLGDSHMRFVLHSWQYRLAGHTDYYGEKEKVSSNDFGYRYSLISSAHCSPIGKSMSRPITIHAMISTGPHSSTRDRR